MLRKENESRYGHQRFAKSPCGDRFAALGAPRPVLGEGNRAGIIELDGSGGPNREGLVSGGRKTLFSVGVRWALPLKVGSEEVVHRLVRTPSPRKPSK
jgi:hypothetical protein